MRNSQFIIHNDYMADHLTTQKAISQWSRNGFLYVVSNHNYEL